MTEANLHDYLDIKQLSPVFRRVYWTRNKQEPDASILWPGTKRQIGQWIAGESPIVTAALTRSSDPVVASRVIFSRSHTQRDLWYYGYFYTLPNFRRMGLGEQVMRKGLAAIKLAGGRYCSCYVAENNSASAELAMKLGFYKLPFVRIVFRGSDKTVANTVNYRLSEMSNATPLPQIFNLINTVIDNENGTAIIHDELSIRRPWKPWKAPDSQLFNLYYEKTNLGIVRTGINKTVFLPDPFNSKIKNIESLIQTLFFLSKNKSPIVILSPYLLSETLRHSEIKIEYEIFNVFYRDLSRF